MWRDHEATGSVARKVRGSGPEDRRDSCHERGEPQANQRLRQEEIDSLHHRNRQNERNGYGLQSEVYSTPVSHQRKRQVHLGRRSPVIIPGASNQTRTMKAAPIRAAPIRAAPVRKHFSVPYDQIRPDCVEWFIDSEFRRPSSSAIRLECFSAFRHRHGRSSSASDSGRAVCPT